MGGDGQGGGATATAQLLDEDSRRYGIGSGAIPFFGDIEAKQAQRSHFVDGRPGKFVRFIGVCCEWLYLIFDEIPDHFLQQPLFFREIEVHGIPQFCLEMVV